MPDATFNTVVLQTCLDRMRAGEPSAANDLLRAVHVRLQKLAARMIRGFPNVRGVADSDDVLQSSLIRLLRTLENLRPRTPRDFFNLAAVHIRRVLIDLARRTKGKETIPLNLAGSSGLPRPHEPAAPDSSDTDSDRWVRFHEAVDQLPSEEREVVGLVFYHGWTQGQIAELFQVDERTIRRRWSSACRKIRQAAGTDVEYE
jgi:RNA polymerase sigma-70 factor (ECF subfamily)